MVKLDDLMILNEYWSETIVSTVVRHSCNSETNHRYGKHTSQIVEPCRKLIVLSYIRYGTLALIAGICVIQILPVLTVMSSTRSRICWPSRLRMLSRLSRIDG